MSQPFDQDELLEEIDNDMDFLEELIDMLAADAPALIESIKQGMAGSDAEAVWQNAHALKSMVGNFAAHDAHALSFQIEQAGRAEQLDEVSDTLESLEGEIASLLSALTDLLKQQR